MLVYHGSTCRVDMPLADVCRNNLDFGRGFYVTGLRTQAIKWALRAVNTGKPHWLNTYELDIDIIRSTRYRYLRFDAYNEAWFDFVVACRRGYDIWQQYDAIEGGIADDRVIRTIDLFLGGDYTREEALRRLVHEAPNNQMCLVSQEVIDNHLHPVDACELSPDDVIGMSGKLQAGVTPQPVDAAMQTKFNGIIRLLSKHLHLAMPRAMHLFYTSDTYLRLAARIGDLACQSDAYLADEIILELQRKQ